MTMKEKRDVLSHAFLVVASLFMVATISVAWFISNTRSAVDNMSFATQWSGTGAVVYPGTVDLTQRSYIPNTLTNTVTWGAAMGQNTAEITVKDMVPGQCEYYLIKANVPLDVFVKGVTIDGNTVTDGTTEPLAQCLAVSLLPVTDQTEENLQSGGIATLKMDLVRLPIVAGQTTEQLRDTPFRHVTIPAEQQISPATASNRYVLAVFCDPVYLQNKEVHQLTGTIHFALRFAERKG